MAEDLTQLQTDVDAAREAYRAAERQLMSVADGMFASGEEAGLHLLEIAEEFGAGQAVLRMLEHAEGIAPLHPRTIESLVADQADNVEQALELVLETRDRLDLATSKREARLLSVTPNRLRAVNFGGREFVIDERLRELRSVDVPGERYELGTEHAVHAPDVNSPTATTLTEALGRNASALPTQVRPDKGRSRQR
jgi:hypothetical protein